MEDIFDNWGVMNKKEALLYIQNTVISNLGLDTSKMTSKETLEYLNETFGYFIAEQREVVVLDNQELKTIFIFECSSVYIISEVELNKVKLIANRIIGAFSQKANSKLIRKFFENTLNKNHIFFKYIGYIPNSSSVQSALCIADYIPHS